MKKIFFLLIQSLFISLYAQDVPIGQFKEYLAYKRFHSVAQDRENIYAATDKSILVVDKRDGSKEKWSKLNGLSDIGVQTLHSDPNGRLIIVYRNSNIDVIKDYKVHNIRDILNKQMSGSKTVNNVSTLGELAYFACDFGVVILDLKTLLVKDSWFTIRNNETYRAFFVTIQDGRYYLATDKGVFSLPITASNPADFSTWMQESELGNAPFILLCSYQNKLYAARNDGSYHALFVYKDSQWEYDESMKMDNYKSFDVKDDKMLVCDWNHVKIFTGETYVQYNWKLTPPNKWANGRKAILDDKMNVWVADNSSGLVHINTETKKNENITAEGPANNSAYGLCFTDGILAVVPGERTPGLYPAYVSPAISTMKGDRWWTHIDFSQVRAAGTFNSVAINPLNTNEIFMASWIGGLFKINEATNEPFCYNNSNSILRSPQERLNKKDSTLFLAGLAIDKQNRLWMTQSEVTDCIKVKDLNTTEEKWYSLSLKDAPLSEIMAEHILIDSRNYKWITFPRQSRLFVFSENGGALDNTAMHKSAEVDVNSQANVVSKRITCIAEDREGRIWIGANLGVKVVYDANTVFNKQIYAKNILIEQAIGDTSYVQNLLEFEYITCIAVDAADRKWIGTEGAGVFLISPTGTQQLFHFTAQNSPLFSNRINDIKINPENGEVFIATAEGLISYRGTATVGKENYKEVLVFPNPVREDYFGPIAVKGLMEDSFCKITDAAGKLVWQGYAYGGQLIWNGKDLYGKRPVTGVYFVMASSKTGKEKKVAKFLFIQ
jgi:ligand-binding sensor domain-containing protein